MRVLLCLVLILPLAAPAAEPAEFFETEVRPLLSVKCFACHTQTKMGGLEMVSRAALLKGGNSGPAVEPRAPERSLLIRAVRYRADRLKMPPTERLSPEQVKILTKWVEDGAVWPESPVKNRSGANGKFLITNEHRKFWAFRPVGKDEPPPGDGTAIDRFVDAKLTEAGLEPTPPTDRRTLLRRVYYDLIGLPPTPEEVAAFQADDSPQAFAYVVNRLLADWRYGERWGRHWLDVARYSDDRLNSTHDEPYPNAFRYRDWVIRAFNDDMPYDLFIKAQLAGDQLSEDERGGRTGEELIGGLGMFALSPKFQDDRIDLTGRGLLGLTIGCAQCHDHKFDPIPTEDYYALLGIFNSTQVGEHPLAPPCATEGAKTFRDEGFERFARHAMRIRGIPSHCDLIIGGRRGSEFKSRRPDQSFSHLPPVALSGVAVHTDIYPARPRHPALPMFTYPTLAGGPSTSNERCDPRGTIESRKIE